MCNRGQQIRPGGYKNNLALSIVSSIQCRGCFGEKKIPPTSKWMLLYFTMRQMYGSRAVKVQVNRYYPVYTKCIVGSAAPFIDCLQKRCVRDKDKSSDAIWEVMFYCHWPGSQIKFHICTMTDGLHPFLLEVNIGVTMPAIWETECIQSFIISIGKTGK